MGKHNIRGGLWNLLISLMALVGGVVLVTATGAGTAYAVLIFMSVGMVIAAVSWGHMLLAKREQLEKERRRTAALRRAREKRTEEKAITPSRKVWRTAGSGFILRGTSYVLTSYHVFQKGVSIRVTLPSGEVYPALVVTKDRNNDLALVQLKGMRPMGGFIAQLRQGRPVQVPLAHCRVQEVQDRP